MIGPFAALPADLERLGDKEAVDLVRSLIWADASASGIGGNQIDAPAPQDVGDGGIDAEVLHSAAEGKYGIIKKGNTRYQVKSGRFSPSESGIKKILFDERGNLKGRIKSCLDKGGTLVVAFTKWDDPDRTDEGAAGKFRDVLAGISPKYAGAKVEVWRQNTMRGFLEHFPALKLRLIGAPIGGHYSIDEWAGLGDMGNRAHLGAPQERFIAELRDHLRDDSRAMHVRITGEPGMGKTRLALEACRADDLAGLVIYVDGPKSLGEGGIVYWLTKRDVDARAILVVDECDYESLAYYWNMLERHSPRIKMVTIYNEPGGDGRTTKSMTVPPLPDAEVARILSGYGIKENALPRLIGLCRPYPRAAHMIGQSHVLDPDGPVGAAGAAGGWSRFIASRLAVGTPEYKTRRAVLLWLGLFKRFGYDGEARTIQELVSRHEGISPGDFRRTVSKLREMKLLQGSRTLYITPKILHAHLWSEWWKTYGEAEVPAILEVLDRAADADGGYGLRGWFYDMFAYAGGSTSPDDAARMLLKSGRFLGGGEDPPEARHGASALLALGRAAPVPVLDYIEEAVAGMSAGALGRFRDGRRAVVWALDYIAKRTEHAARAARILVPLAEAENESGITNNATGVLHDVFVPGSTSMPPADQLALLAEINGSHAEGRRRLAVGGCKKALDPHATVMYFDTDGQAPEEHPGRRAAPARAEVVGYRAAALDMLGSHIEDGGPLAAEAADVVLGLARLLLREPELSGRVVGILEAIHRGGARTERLIGTLASAAELDAGVLGGGTMDRIRSLLESAEGDGGVHAGLKRHVGGGGCEGGGGYSASQEEGDAKMRGLAGAALRSGALAAELPWLVTGEAREGHRFGYALAAQDRGYAMLAAILEAVGAAGAAASGLLVGGYLARVRRDEPGRWASALDSIYGDRRARAVLPEAVAISGITDRSMSQIIGGVSSGEYSYDVLDMLKYPNTVSPGTFARCIEMLLGRPEGGAAMAAMRLVYHYFARGKNPLPRGLVESALLHPRVAGPAPGAEPAPMDPQMWREAALRLMDAFPDSRPAVAEAIVENYGKSDLLRGGGSPSLDALESAARAAPGPVWGIVSARLGPPLDRRCAWLRARLRGCHPSGGKSILSAFPARAAADWAAERPAERAVHMAGLLPEDYEIVRPFLSEHGDRDGVREALADNLLGEGRPWSGAGHYRAMGERYAALRRGEDDPRAAAWLDYFVERIDGLADEAAEADMRAA